MSKFLGFFLIGTALMGAVVSCSAVPDERGEATGELPGVRRQALVSCSSDADCAYAQGTSSWPPIYLGEHCGFDGECHTDAEEPTCGLWTGTYPNCEFYPGACRVSYCAYPATCEGDGFCTLGSGMNTCSPYAYSEPCATECEDDFDCDSFHSCESSPIGNVCG